MPYYSDDFPKFYVRILELMPITVAARSKAWTMFARSNAGFVGSNPSQGTDVFVRVYSVFVLSCVGSGLATGWSLVQESYRLCEKDYET
jgi:hypothetical protein